MRTKGRLPTILLAASRSAPATLPTTRTVASTRTETSVASRRISPPYADKPPDVWAALFLHHADAGWAVTSVNRRLHSLRIAWELCAGPLSLETL